jgi:hypothetical protein
MDKETILRLLATFIDGKSLAKEEKIITKVDFFTDKLTGCDNASENRSRLCQECGLPDNMTPNALLEAMNLLYGYKEYKVIIDKLFK